MNKHKKKSKFKRQMHVLTLKVHHTNIRGLHSNITPVHYHLETNKPHLLFLTETQIRSPSDTAYLDYPGYVLEHRFVPRAGICVYVREDICYLRLRDLEHSNFSTIWLLVDTGSAKIVYAGVYRSHSGNSETSLLTEYLSQSADIAQQRYPSAQLVFLGDFNAHHKEWLFPNQITDHAGNETYKLATELNLTQLVQDPTRVPDVDSQTANCLDLLMTSEPDRYSVSVSPPLGTSDHCLVKSVSVYSPTVSCAKGKRRLWKYKLADWDEMRHFFASYPWKRACFPSRDPTECAKAVTEVIQQAMEYFIPFSYTSPSSTQRPWFGSHCAYAEMKKNEAYLEWADARTRKAPDLRAKKKAFNAATKTCKKVQKRAYFDHIRRIGSKLSSYPSGSKAFWSLAKSVETNFCRSSLPPLRKPDGSLAHTAEEKANLFAKLFAEASHLDDTNLEPPRLPSVESSMPDIRIRQKEVLRTLRSLDVNKASGPDGIPAVVLKTCAPELSPILTHLFRLSLDLGIVPRCWKLANVQPVPKKGSRAEPVNYRPISITSLLCKSMERVINNRLLAYLEGNELLSDRQYGFRRNRSTGDLLVYATHILSEAVEMHGEALAVSLDISKAFDRVWHDGLLSKLPSYGLPPRFCNWVSDFLKERSIRVVLDGTTSDTFAINAGVPQGSVLSATLFLLHINDLLKPGTFGYADDTTVVAKYMPDARVNNNTIHHHREDMLENLNLTLRGISDWGDANMVQFNPGKTQACLFSTKKKTLSVGPTFRGVSIPVGCHLNLLGITLTAKLNFGSYIESKAQVAAKKLSILCKVRRFFNPQQLLTLYQAQIRSCLEYCCHLIDGSAKYQLEALDSIERRAKRLIGDDKLVETRLQSLYHRRRVASLSVFYRIFHGECAQELHNLIPPSPFHYRTTRQTAERHPFLVHIPPIRTKRHESSFLIKTAKDWNALPASLFPEHYNLDVFKRKVNRFLLLSQRATTSTTSSLTNR